MGFFFIARVSARKAREEVGERWGAASEPLGVFLLRFHLKSDPLFIPKGAGHFTKLSAGTVVCFSLFMNATI